MRGLNASFALILVSEIGDKTFFIAALLAMRKGRSAVLTGAMLALSVMTIISVFFGKAFSKLPDFVQTDFPLGKWMATALLAWFGVNTLR